MNFLQKAVACALLLQSEIKDVQSKQLKGQASSGNFIIHEEYYDELSWYSKISISSNVPVTIQRYSDDYYMEGEQPVQSNDAKVLVTSDCAATTYVPTVTWGPDSIDVSVQGTPADIPYLASSSYDAKWSYESFWCRHYMNTPAPVPSRLNGSSTFSLKSALFPSSVKGMLRRIMRTDEEQPEDDTVDILSSNACNVNVEVMLDGCSHDMDVTAPTVRVIDASLENKKSQQNAQDECVYDHEADIMFSGESVLEGIQSLDVPSVMCHRAVPGRPFVDSTGSTLQASPLIVPSVAEKANAWSVDNAELVEAPLASSNNSTFNLNRILLGQEWTKGALGEHASVASFSAFSIALMTNQAPSDLVEDALHAALDEVRHAKTSFDIASRLTGKEIGPGPLPGSSHTFGHDLKALVLAVAEQGCVEETLSALEAAAEVDTINAALENGADGTKYYGIDKEILTWIRDELHTIALEESNHAALAWRTFKWVCSVDSDACDAAKEHVLSRNELERAFQRRFQSFDGKSETFDIMEEAWKKIYSDHEVDPQTCINNHDDGVINSESHVSIMAENIVHGVSCMQLEL